MSVSVESLSIQDVEFITAFPSHLNDGYVLYQENGGLLPEARYAEFLTIRDVLSRKEIPLHRKNQATCMAYFADLVLTPQEIFLYGYLRNITSNGYRANSQNPNTSLQPDVYQLTDQRLLAEIFRMEGKKDILEQFTAAFPNIFKKEGS